MKVKKIHEWNLSYDRARTLQTALASRLQFLRHDRPPQIVAGMDCAFSADKKRICAAIIALKLPEMRILEKTHAVADVTFPYIPGLLSFREAPVCIRAAEKLSIRPDVFVIDGQGLAHPRRLGLAAHLGLFFDTPTIGCAKSRLVGTYDQPGNTKGDYTELCDRNEIIGAVLRTRTNVKPLFVSVGNRCTLDYAVQTVMACAVRYRLPEPTRLAHLEVSGMRLRI